MAPTFTHNFEFSIGTEGNGYIKGECEFDEDGKMSYKINNTSSPLTEESLDYFLKLTDLIHEIYEKTGEVKLIKIKLKE